MMKFLSFKEQLITGSAHVKIKCDKLQILVEMMDSPMHRKYKAMTM